MSAVGTGQGGIKIHGLSTCYSGDLLKKAEGWVWSSRWIWAKVVGSVIDPQPYHSCLQHKPDPKSPGHFYSTSTFAVPSLFLFLQREKCILLLTISDLGQQSSIFPAFARRFELALAKSPVCIYTATFARLSHCCDLSARAEQHQ